MSFGFWKPLSLLRPHVLCHTWLVVWPVNAPKKVSPLQFCKICWLSQKNTLFKCFLYHCCYFRIDVFPLGVYSPNDFSFCSFKVNGKAPPVSLRVFKEKQYLHDSSFLLSFASVLMAAETTGLNMQPKARCRSVTVVAQVSTRRNSVTLQVHRSRILLRTWRWALQFSGMHCSFSVQSWLHLRGTVQQHQRNFSHIHPQVLESCCKLLRSKALHGRSDRNISVDDFIHFLRKRCWQIKLDTGTLSSEQIQSKGLFDSVGN